MAILLLLTTLTFALDPSLCDEPSTTFDRAWIIIHLVPCRSLYTFFNHMFLKLTWGCLQFIDKLDHLYVTCHGSSSFSVSDFKCHCDFVGVSLLRVSVHWGMGPRNLQFKIPLNGSYFHTWDRTQASKMFVKFEGVFSRVEMVNYLIGKWLYHTSATSFLKALDPNPNVTLLGPKALLWSSLVLDLL